MLVLALAGCASSPPGVGGTGSQDAADETVARQLNVSAIVVVVGDVYQQGHAAETIFLGAEDGVAETPEFSPARDQLATDLGVPVQPSGERAFAGLVAPIDPASEEAGLSITLGRFFADAEGHLYVKVSLSPPEHRHSCIEYDLAPDEEGWSIAETKPGCVPGAGTFENYDSALERMRSGRCIGLWASAGTCGDWLFILETSGFGGHKAYYDPQTREIIALEGFTDYGPSPTWFVFGDVDCAMDRPDETVPCGTQVP